MKIRNRFRGLAPILALLLVSIAGAATAQTAIHVLSNRADSITDGDALVEVTPVPPAGTTVDLGGVDVTADFAERANGRYMGLVTGLPVGSTALTVTLPDTSGATITLENHPPEGPVFNGPHLHFWDCTTEREGLGAPDDPKKCNAPAVVEYFYMSTSTDGYEPYDESSPPAPTEIADTTTDQGATVRNIVRHEKGAYARGIYAFAVLHDPDDALAPWEPPAGWNGKLYYPFGASCNTNYTQGSTPNVMNATRLAQGFAVAMNSLNTLGHHCSTWLSAEAAMMVKERFIETFGRPRFTISTGGSGGAIGQNMVSNMYPGITNGLIPSQVYPDTTTTGIEVFDCFALQTYWPTAAVPFTTLQRAAVDGKGPANTTCSSWAATFAPAGNPSTGCFGEQTLPALNLPFVEERDYNAVTNPDGCRASAQEIMVNVIGRRAFDGFANGISENIGVQYGLNALNLPLGDPGKITFAQFLDMNLNIGGFTIDGVKSTERSRAHPGVSEILYRSGAVTDGSGLAHNAIINLPAELNVEFHTPAHSYGLKQRLIETNGHSDNFALWHHGPSGLAWDTMNQWLEAIHAAGGIDPVTGIMDPATIVSEKPAAAVDTCFDDDGNALPLDDPFCAVDVFSHPRVEAGMPITHDVPECTLKTIDPSDYAGAFPPPTAAELSLLETVFPEGVCDYSVPSPKHTGSIQWLSYENGPGGEPMGDPPVSTPF